MVPCYKIKLNLPPIPNSAVFYLNNAIKNMTTVLQARPKGFVNTPAIEQLTIRALSILKVAFLSTYEGRLEPEKPP